MHGNAGAGELNENQMLAAMHAALAHSHLAMAEALRIRADVRPFSRDAYDILWAQIFAHQTAAAELLKAAQQEADS